MFRNFCVVFLAALTTFILLLTFYIARSDLSLRLILFSAGDVLYIKNILPVVAAAIPPFAGLSGLIYFAGRKHLVLIVLFFLSSLFCFVLYTDFVTVFLPGTLHEDKNFRTREQKQADHVLKLFISPAIRYFAAKLHKKQTGSEKSGKKRCFYHA